MRIAVNTRFLLKDRLEGMGWYIWEVVRRMVIAHPDDDFLFLFDRPFDASFTDFPNVRGVVVSPPARHPVLFLAWYDWAVPRVLRREKVAVFWSPDNFCSLRSPCPTLLTIHDLAYKYYPTYISRAQLAYYQYFTPRFVAAAAHIHTVSEYVKHDIEKHFPLAVGKISTAYNGCRKEFQPISDTEITNIRLQYSTGSPYFLYVGAIHPRKNVHRLIAAFDVFKSTSGAAHKLLLCGRMAWGTEEVSAALAAAKHRNDIILPGFVPDAALPKLMAAAAALTYISLFEGFGVPLLEAMNCNVPVLTSNTTSMPEVVGKAGLLVDPTNINDMASGMRKLATDADFCQKLVEIGQMERQRFDWNSTAETIYQQLQKIK